MKTQDLLRVFLTHIEPSNVRDFRKSIILFGHVDCQKWLKLLKIEIKYQITSWFFQAVQRKSENINSELMGMIVIKKSFCAAFRTERLFSLIFRYLISSSSFRGKYSFLNLEIVENLNSCRKFQFFKVQRADLTCDVTSIRLR